MRPIIKYIAYLSIIPLLIGLFFFSNIKGYYRFKSLCAQEGGLRVYEPLEKNVGWLADDKSDAKVAALLSGVGFVRYTDKDDGITYDLHRRANNPQKESSFVSLVEDKSNIPTYKWHSTHEILLSELRLSRSGYEILDINNRILARYYFFSYEKFDISNTPLNSPSGTRCPDSEETDFYGIPSALKKLNAVFKN